MFERLRNRFDARVQGALLCAVGLMLLTGSSLVSGALGLEFVAMAFWCWARSADDAVEQVNRWAWLRRPAQGMWLAAAVAAMRPAVPAWPGFAHLGASWLLPRLEALGVVWAGLELLAALPLARPYSDLSGPLLAVRPWLPTLLPAAGFAVLWRHADAWVPVPEVRGITEFLLVVTAALAALRAYGRRQWAAALRWLTVSDSALAALVVASGVVGPQASLMLWLGACGGRTYMLAGELRGATSRRGATLPRLWRAAAWTGSAALSWPLLIAAGFGRGTGLPHALRFALIAIPVVLIAWVSVRRIVRAPERRQVMRRDAAMSLSHLSALITLLLGPAALLLGWWTGFEASWPGSVIALAPALAGGLTALLLPAPRPGAVTAGIGKTARRSARGTFRLVTALERRAVEGLARVGAALVAPLRDVHTGDAQEYLLFLVGLSVLALVLPFLR